VIRYADIPKMTVRELCDLAEQVMSAPAGSKRAAALAARIGAATTYLEDADACQQMLWWLKPPASRKRLQVRRRTWSSFPVLGL
jgi:hypothetical protein